MHVRPMDLDCLENTIKDYGTDMNVTVTTGNDFDFADWLKENPKKPPEPISYKHDPVALAMASYRFWETTGHRWKDLEDLVPLEEDLVRAQELRAYYAGQMTFDALKGSGLSTPFRRKLYAIVTNCHQYTKEDIGLLYRLPYFYKEDQTLDQLVREFKSVEHSVSKELAGVFSLHKRMLRSRRGGEYYHYWLKMDGSPHLFKLVVKSDDVLRPLVESLLATPRMYTATAYYKGMQGQRRFNYIQLGSLKLVS
jgi:hypothetical protein